MQCHDLPGVVRLPFSLHEDQRGVFSKVYQRESIEDSIPDFCVSEIFYSVSKRNVIRGMHYQAPPHHQRKIIFCSMGLIQNVLFDLRSQSKTFGSAISFEIGDKQRQAVLVPSGVANGFRVISDFAVVHYVTDSKYNAHFDCGVHWNSIDFPWGLSENEAIVSDRDRDLPRFRDIQTPFSN